MSLIDKVLRYQGIYAFQYFSISNLISKENELTLQSSRLKLIVSSSSSYYSINGPAVLSALLPHSHSPGSSQSSRTNLTKFSSHGPLAAVGSSMSNISISSVQSTSSNRSTVSTSTNSYYNNLTNGSGVVNFFSSNDTPPRNHQSSNSSSPNTNSHSEIHVFLFTSDFERNAWVEEINSAIYACKIDLSY